MNVAAAAGQVLVRLGHEAGHDAKARRNLLGAGFEQERPVSLGQRLAETNCRFKHARASFGVQALHRHAKGQHLIHQGVEKRPVLVHAQQRVAKHARCQHLGGHAFLGSPALRRLDKVEPLELHAGHDLKAHFFSALEHAFQRLTWALGVRRAIRIDKFTQKEGHAIVPGHVARGVQVQPRQRVRKTVLPAGGRGVVVGVVHHVPTQHHVAKAEAATWVGLGRA